MSTLSHELNEAITDPSDPAIAWNNDSSGNEIGDVSRAELWPPARIDQPQGPW